MVKKKNNNKGGYVKNGTNKDRRSFRKIMEKIY